MLTLTGTIRAATTIGGGVNRKTGEAIPVRPVLQVEGLDSRGLVQVYTLTVRTYRLMKVEWVKESPSLSGLGHPVQR